MRKKLFSMAVLCMLQCTCVQAQNNETTGEKSFYPIKNDVFWDTREGQPIYSQGGGIFKFTDPKTQKQKYYWYGVHYKEAELYRNDPSVTHEKNRFESVTCYTSDNLTSSPYVTLEDGYCTLSAKIRNSSGFSKLQIYASTARKTYRCAVKNENPDRTTIHIKRLFVKDGKVEIGFLANAKAGAYCHIDDVSLVKEVRH